MNNNYVVFLAFLCLSNIFSINLSGQCAPEESLLTVNITTDNWGYESSWNVTGLDGTVYAEVPQDTYNSNESYSQDVCIPATACITFNLHDSYGDGIIGNGGFSLMFNGELILPEGIDFQYSYAFTYNCGPGQTCNSAEVVTQGSYTTSIDDHWYSFTADSTGIYEISSCLTANQCDTEIWVYEDCNSEISEDNEGTVFYGDNGDCDSLAVVPGYFSAGTTYLIRIGDADNACTSDSIQWEINYFGPIIGCTDPNSCNYNPLATIDDDSCIPFGNPECPAGPDLLISQSALENSIYVTVEENNDPCLIAEGCMNGYGERTLIRFTTRIDNIGEADYFIGVPEEDNPQFTYGNCHGHYHYDGYAEYVLFDANGTKLPIGFKNGFCVLDLTCDTGSPQYGCNYMGITAGCGDIYNHNLQCQSIDVTNTPDGNYTFVTRVNWDNAPDALGQYEMDTLNNWAQVCIKLDRSAGPLEVILLDDCPPYTDCAGILYGDTQPDCNGECGGTALMGDLDANSLQEMEDAQSYVSAMTGNDIQPTSCNDLSGEGAVTIYDAALMSSCVNFGNAHSHQTTGPHNHCDFSGIVNENDLITLRIGEWNPAEQYIDIEMRHPSASIVAYQFQMSGIQLTQAENLVDPAVYPISPDVNMTNQTVYGISYQDSIILKTSTPHPIVRLHYSAITAAEICIEAIQDVVNQDYEAVITAVEGGCLDTDFTGTNNLVKNLSVETIPNPANQFVSFKINNLNGEKLNLQIKDATGRIVREFNELNTHEFTLDCSALTAGMYFYEISGQTYQATGKLNVVH